MVDIEPKVPREIEEMARDTPVPSHPQPDVAVSLQPKYIPAMKTQFKKHEYKLFA